MRENEREWLDNLKVGDPVMLMGGYGRGPRGILCIKRMTKTQIVAGIHRFRRRDGMEPGSDFWRSWIAEPTPELEQALKAARNRRKVSEIDFRALTDETIATIVAAIEADANMQAGQATAAQG